MTGRLAAIGLLALAACHRDPPPALQVASEAASDDGTAAAKDPAPADERALWFPAGPGRDAILARERGDHASAIAKLDELLARTDVPAGDVAAAQWLRGLEAAAAGDHRDAARRFGLARVAPELAAVEPRLRILQAQALLDASDPAGAWAVVDDMDPRKMIGSPLGDDILVVQADALVRTDDVAGARARYERYLAEFGRGPRRTEVMVKLARLLVKTGAHADLEQAIGLYEALAIEVPLSDFGEEAIAELPGLRTQAKLARSAAEQRGFDRKVAQARIDAMIDRSRYKQAIKAADQLLGESLTPIERCAAHFAKATAVFKQRERAKSRPLFEQAVGACGKAGKDGRDLVVKAGYQAGRGRYAEGKHREAALAFEALATAHADHSYADDAWVLAGESWEEHGEPDKARAAWRKALAIAGDMAEEARRRLLVAAFAAGDDDEARGLAEDGLVDKGASAVDRSKLEYFRGRALMRLGQRDQARAAWLSAVTHAPLDYPALQAASRLRELGDDALAEALEVMTPAMAEAAAAEPAPRSGAAVVLARLGLGEWAKEELDADGVGGWPAVAVLDRAGLYPAGQKLVANLGGAWRTQPPRGESLLRWKWAHPQPFRELIEPGEGRLGVPQWLTYAIMQTESRFDPQATSYAGARGLVQLMPSTARAEAEKAGIDLKDDGRLYDPTTNLELGMNHLGRLVARFGGGDRGVALAIPSYNAGAGAVDRWLTERASWDLDVFIEGIPFDETRKYTQSVLGRWLVYRVLYGTAETAAERVPYLALELPGR